MSLINEALKKAQRMRHQEGPGTPTPSADPSVAADAPHSSSLPLRRGKAPRSQMVVFAVAIPAVIVLSVGLTWWLLRPAATPTVALTTPAPEVPPTPVAVEPTVAPAPEPVIVALPTVTSATPSPANETVPLPAETPAAMVAAPAEPSRESAEAPSGPRANPRVNAFLDTLRVTGIRASATDPRVSMNDRVFRLNDIVDRTLELRIVGIAPEGLTFIDPSGTVYKVQF